MSLKIPENI